MHDLYRTPCRFKEVITLNKIRTLQTLIIHTNLYNVQNKQVPRT